MAMRFAGTSRSRSNPGSRSPQHWPAPIDPTNIDAELTNCAIIEWPLATDNEFQTNFLAEKALADLDDPRYPTGPVDGIIDPVTSDSILAYQTDNGLETHRHV